MTHGLCAWLTIVIFMPFQLLAQSESFRVGYFDLPPHTQNEVGSAGPALHYFDKIAGRMQVDVRYQVMPLPRLLKQLDNNKLDAVLLLAGSAERQQSFIYPQQPFFVSHGALAVRTGVQTNVDSFLKQSSNSIAIWQQGYQSGLIKSFAGRFVILSGDNISARAAEMQGKDRVDAFYEPDIYSLRHSIQHNTLSAQLYILELPNDRVPLYTVFSRQGAEKYLQSYEQALQQQTEAQSYLEYLTQWLTTEAADTKAKMEKPL